MSIIKLRARVSSTFTETVKNINNCAPVRLSFEASFHLSSTHPIETTASSVIYKYNLVAANMCGKVKKYKVRFQDNT